MATYYTWSSTAIVPERAPSMTGEREDVHGLAKTCRCHLGARLGFLFCFLRTSCLFRVVAGEGWCCFLPGVAVSGLQKNKSRKDAFCLLNIWGEVIVVANQW